MTYKRVWISLAVLIVAWLGFSKLYAEVMAEDLILGVWANEPDEEKGNKSTAHVKISKEANGEFVGTIVWLLEPENPDGTPRLDIHNPEQSLQSRPLMGLEMLHGFHYNPKNGKWLGGYIYDPKKGKTYRSEMTINPNNPDLMHLKGKVFIFSRTTDWTRIGGGGTVQEAEGFFEELVEDIEDFFDGDDDDNENYDDEHSTEHTG